MRTWHVTDGNDGYKLIIEEAPWWAYALEWAYGSLDELTGCRLCGTGLGEWAWNAPLGRPRYEAADDDGVRWLQNSLAGRLYDLGSKAISFAWTHASVHEWISVADTLGKKLIDDDGR